MNILFYTEKQIDVTLGGIERATYNTARGLTDNFCHRCYSAYSVPMRNAWPGDSPFVEEIWLDASETGVTRLLHFISNHDIDVVISQNSYQMVSLLAPHRERNSFKLVFAFHFEPGWEFKGLTARYYLEEATRQKSSYLAWAKVVAAPLLRLHNWVRWRSAYRSCYRKSDAVVLLSKTFFEGYHRFAGINDESKLFAVPNSLSFEVDSGERFRQDKQKIALIVSRLEEHQKRISDALLGWKYIKESPYSDGWRLLVVGDGSSRPDYERLVSNRNIRDVEFLGRQEPERFYRVSSIFLMTSVSEGWGLTLMEAQQYGVVPIAYESYPSIRDIITTGYNGVLVENGSPCQLADAVLSVMRKQDYRAALSDNCIVSCQRFSTKNVSEQWNRLLLGL